MICVYVVVIFMIGIFVFFFSFVFIFGGEVVKLEIDLVVEFLGGIDLVLFDVLFFLFDEILID